MTSTPELKKPEKKPEKKKVIWTKEERDTLKEKYGSEIIVENGSYEDVNTTQAPSDAYIIKYMHEDKIRFEFQDAIGLVNRLEKKLWKFQ